MKVIIGADKNGSFLKNFLIEALIEEGYVVIDATKNQCLDFVDSSVKVIEKVYENDQNAGIIIDAYGSGSFMVATKHKGVVAAQVSDERTAYMTREHNNSRIITLASDITGPALAKNICLEFLKANYDGGRHQVRVDMLNEMC